MKCGHAFYRPDCKGSECKQTGRTLRINSILTRLAATNVWCSDTVRCEHDFTDMIELVNDAREVLK